MKTRNKIILGIFIVAGIHGAIEKFDDEHHILYSEQHYAEKEAKKARFEAEKAAQRAEEERQKELLKQEECLRHKNKTPAQWDKMSSLLQASVPSECRPEFAGKRNAAGFFKASERASETVLDKAVDSAKELLNKEF